jgi:hypothetical protein
VDFFSDLANEPRHRELMARLKLPIKADFANRISLTLR